MKRLALLLGPIALLALTWALVLDDLAATAKRAAIYQLRRGETVLEYPGVAMDERIRGFGSAADALEESSQSAPPLKRQGGKPATKEQPPSLDDVLAKMNAKTVSRSWLRLTPERRWRLYTSPEMRPVFLGTRIVGGGLGLILLLALLRTAGRGIFNLLFAPVMILWSYRQGSFKVGVGGKWTSCTGHFRCLWRLICQQDSLSKACFGIQSGAVTARIRTLKPP